MCCVWIFCIFLSIFFIQFILTSEEFAKEPAVKRFSVVSRGDRNSGDSLKLSMSPSHSEGEKFIQSDVHRVSTYCILCWVHQIISPILNSKSTNFFTDYLLWFFFNWQAEKWKLFWTNCSQLLKLRKICGKNWENKLVKATDEFVI